MNVTNIDRNLLLFPLYPVEAVATDSELTNSFVVGKFVDVIKCFIDEIFQETVSTVENFAQYLEFTIKDFITEKNVQQKFDDIQLVGSSCLYYFIKYNFTGPLESENDEDILHYILKKRDSVDEHKVKEIEENILNFLCPDDDLIFNNTKQPILLFLAKLIFATLPVSLRQKWYLMRSLYIHQLILYDPSPRIHEELVTVMKYLDDSLIKIKNDELLVLFYLEKIQIHLQLYSETSEVKDLVNKVHSRLHLKEVKLDGRLGKRTRYQRKDVAQLTLRVEIGPETASNVEQVGNGIDETLLVTPVFYNIDYRSSSLPKDQRLDDDVRLPEIQFTDKSEMISLNVIQQAAILSSFMLTKKSEPKDEILTEKLCAYLSYLLNDPKSWNIQARALLQRSLAEVESSRTVERSITQIQSLISEVESSSSSLMERLPMAFSSFIVPKRELDMNLAKLLVQVGAIQSALDIYNRLQMWEEIVACYNHLKLRHKAAEVIRTEMSKRETVQLWCLLGDATDDISCYEKAWELSGCKSGRAQKHWALYYFKRNQYEESVPHFQKSLEINSLQVPLWFNYGYAALVLENWELSAKAYRRYCSLEPDSFEAWNNLAKSYIKLGQKNRAWGALQEAVKCNYDNWKVWDNLMAVSADCADFNEVIRCYHRILDIKGKHIDNEVLDVLINAIKNKILGCDLSVLQKQALQLLGRLTSMIMNDSELWRLYAVLTECCDVNENNQQKVVQYLQKAQRIASQEPGWEQTVEQCKNVISVSLHLSSAQKICASLVTEHQRGQHLYSAKLMLRRVHTKIKKVHTDALGELNQELSTDVENLETELEDIEKKLQTLNTY